MFFNKHIKQGEQLGSECLAMIKRCFAFDRGLDFEQNTFTPPADFFDDLYIRGFIASWIAYLIEFDFNGVNWKTEKKGECVHAAMKTIDPSGKLYDHHLSLVDLAVRERVLGSDDFKKGQNDAISWVGTLYQRLPENDPDPLIQEAKQLAKTLDKEVHPIGTRQERTLGALGAAFFMLTIFKYVKRKWSPDIPHDTMSTNTSI